jgi:DNA-binding NarL/FixJ family response regulator
MDVVGQAADAEHLLDAVRETRPDVVLLDIRMPPTHTLEGLHAARDIRSTYGPSIGIVLLTSTLKPATRSTCSPTPQPESGTSSKTVSSIPLDLADAITRVAAGGSAIDPIVIQHLVKRRHHEVTLAALTDRESQVLRAMAEGRSNSSIARHLSISEKTVEACTNRIFGKLNLEQHPDDHRRVRAVLTYLQAIDTASESFRRPPA